MKLFGVPRCSARKNEYASSEDASSPPPEIIGKELWLDRQANQCVGAMKRNTRSWWRWVGLRRTASSCPSTDVPSSIVMRSSTSFADMMRDEGSGGSSGSQPLTQLCRMEGVGLVLLQHLTSRDVLSLSQCSMDFNRFLHQLDGDEKMPVKWHHIVKEWGRRVRYYRIMEMKALFVTLELCCFTFTTRMATNIIVPFVLLLARLFSPHHDVWTMVLLIILTGMAAANILLLAFTLIRWARLHYRLGNRPWKHTNKTTTSVAGGGFLRRPLSRWVTSTLQLVFGVLATMGWLWPASGLVFGLGIVSALVAYASHVCFTFANRNPQASKCARFSEPLDAFPFYWSTLMLVYGGFNPFVFFFWLWPRTCWEFRAEMCRMGKETWVRNRSVAIAMVALVATYLTGFLCYGVVARQGATSIAIAIFTLVAVCLAMCSLSEILMTFTLASTAEWLHHSPYPHSSALRTAGTDPPEAGGHDEAAQPDLDAQAADGYDQDQHAQGDNGDGHILNTAPPAAPAAAAAAPLPLPLPLPVHLHPPTSDAAAAVDSRFAHLDADAILEAASVISSPGDDGDVRIRVGEPPGGVGVDWDAKLLFGRDWDIDTIDFDFPENRTPIQLPYRGRLQKRVAKLMGAPGAS
ncbi:unnamed protein product [Vitrella brassicaformis CCMP3155]|uniref:Uncharacterized protein n=2 Tax=Vitrella brassicaformis TaxID=1169539 RepID=A0A0G4ENE7_VITBC|nr:unnamed protein product [Vitrella brassicaformis CCMP3155]|eukprot:CEL98981.1 unnamed protein product [Vitrella brassicaformis CCMP3155]